MSGPESPKELKIHSDRNQDQKEGSADLRSRGKEGFHVDSAQNQPASPEFISRQDIAKIQHTKTADEEITIFSERTLMALMCAGLTATVMTALMLADGSSWPKSLIVGLGAGGPVVLGIVTLLERGGRQ